MEMPALIHGIMEIGSTDDLDQVFQAYKRRWGQLQETEVLQFRKGQEVAFDAKGNSWVGKVAWVNQKTVTVMCHTKNDETLDREVRWRVHPGALRVIEPV